MNRLIIGLQYCGSWWGNLVGASMVGKCWCGRRVSGKPAGSWLHLSAPILCLRLHHCSPIWIYTSALQHRFAPILCTIVVPSAAAGAAATLLQRSNCKPEFHSVHHCIALELYRELFLMQQMHSPKHCIKMQSELILGQSGFFPREQRVASFLRVLLAAAFWLPAKVQRPAGSSAVGKSVASQHSQDRLQSHSRKIRKFCHFFYFSLKLPSL